MKRQKGPVRLARRLLQEALSNYQYDERLQPGQIRLLTVLPGKSGTTLKCELSRHNIEQMPEYNALSYCWGDDARTHHLRLNDRRLAVTRSVHEALQHLRSSLDVLRIWIDQVCISQDDIPERNTQVQQMGQVYERASCTFIWLGPPEPGMEDAQSIVRQYSEDPHDDEWKTRHYWHLKTFFCNPWFHRVWMLQEAVLAQRCVFVYGHDECYESKLGGLVSTFTDWREDKDISRLDPEHYQNEGCADGILSFHYCFERFRREIKDGSSLSLFGLLATSRSRQCVDQLDHVFGLQGLFAKSTIAQRPPEVDYSSTISGVFMNITRLGLLCDGGWDRWLELHKESAQRTTAAVGPDPSSEPSLDGLPSWVPDWACASFSLGFSLWLYGASGTVSYPPCEQNFVNNGARLLVQGVPHSHLDAVTAPTSGLQWGWGELDCVFDQIGASSKHCYHTDGISDAFGRTLVADTYYSSGDQELRRWPSNDPHLEGRPWMASVKDKLYSAAAPACTQDRAFTITKTGHVGFGPMGCRPDDLVVLLKGFKLPVILRKRPTGTYYQMIGPAYVHGIMDGEAWEAAERGEYEFQDFEID